MALGILPSKGAEGKNKHILKGFGVIVDDALVKTLEGRRWCIKDVTSRSECKAVWC